MRYFRFSLATLVLMSLCAASGMMVYPRLAPWREEARLPAPPADPNANPFLATYGSNATGAFLQDESLFGVVADSGLHIWDLNKGKAQFSREGSWRSAFGVDACAIPLAILKTDKTHLFYNLERPETPLFEVKADYINTMQSADGGLVSLHLGEDSAQVWDFVAGRKLWAVSGNARVTLSRDGKWAAVVEYNSSVVRVCDARTGVVQRELKQDKVRLYYALFTPDCSMVVGTEAQSSGNGYVAWSMKDGALVSSWELPANQIRHGAFSPDSRYVAVVVSSGKICVWEIATGRNVLAFTASNSGSNCEALEYFPDGRRLLVGYAAGGPVIFDAISGAELYAVPHAEDEYENVFLAPGKDRMAILSRKGAVRILKYDHREEWWGLATLPEFWLAVVLALGMVGSVVRDWRATSRRQGLFCC